MVLILKNNEKVDRYPKTKHRQYLQNFSCSTSIKQTLVVLFTEDDGGRTAKLVAKVRNSQRDLFMKILLIARKKHFLI